MMSKKMRRYYRSPSTYIVDKGNSHWLQKAKTNAMHLPQSGNNSKKPITKLPHSAYHGDHQHHFHHTKKRPNAMLHNPHHSHHQHHRVPQFRPMIKTF
ncbi:MAG: hypothetical protein GY821_13990 [Gammaproteobacteria bacterium]|nr:hypothetical protein [Gammaproteobacteria bacterium]